MNGWTTTNVYRINGKLVVGNGIEDAIGTYKCSRSPYSADIMSIEMVFGDGRFLTDGEALISDDGKAARSMAVLLEENARLKEEIRLLRKEDE